MNTHFIISSKRPTYVHTENHASFRILSLYGRKNFEKSKKSIVSIPIICNASHLSIMEKNEISFYKIIIYEDKVDRKGTVIVKTGAYLED